MVMDCGQHLLKGWPEPQKVHSILVPGLEERARMLGPLSTFNQISPGTAFTLSAHPCNELLLPAKHDEPGKAHPLGASNKDNVEASFVVSLC